MFLNEDNSENKSVVHIDAETKTFVQRWYIMELRQCNTVGLLDPIPFIFPNFFTESSVKSRIIAKKCCYHILIKIQNNVLEM